MDWFFSATFSGDPFRLFSPSHLTALLLIALLLWMLYHKRELLQKEKWNTSARCVLAAVLLLSEISLQLWYVLSIGWDASYALPLQLCSITLLLSVVVLINKNKLLYEILFFVGIGGASQALLTPELFYPFPHFRFFHFFLAHAGILLSCLFLTVVEGYRPTIRSIWKAMTFLNLLLPVVAVANYLTGGNYMFVARKPANPSVIDFLGPYPWYVLSLEVIAVLFFFLLYIPFALSDFIKRRKERDRTRHIGSDSLMG
ncbi:TIGR02206 family membrane protein [Brevibacillus humidisoli]|uniref:YwaF family protein n=1 Tax=Brevibacillus humidisoli TaxID=2895522 RepID=UPI001E30D766|nr:TIGR02206 family membrane protein [Brevibacillus humidisoli]UFJ41417.1 TIGR02206 family membrane protein [Brevibacillus humidisoli]